MQSCLWDRAISQTSLTYSCCNFSNVIVVSLSLLAGLRSSWVSFQSLVKWCIQIPWIGGCVFCTSLKIARKVPWCYRLNTNVFWMWYQKESFCRIWRTLESQRRLEGCTKETLLTDKTVWHRNCGNLNTTPRDGTWVVDPSDCDHASKSAQHTDSWGRLFYCNFI